MHDTSLRHLLTGAGMRLLCVADAANIESHLLRLDAKDRFLRFCNVIDDKRVRQFVAEIDWTASIFIGRFAEGRLCGVVQLSPCEDRQDGAEFAISVDAAHRGVGIARELLASTVSLARARGIRSLTMTSLSENKAIAHLANDLGFQLSRVQEQVIGELEL